MTPNREYGDHTEHVSRFDISHSVPKSVQFSIASNSAPQANCVPVMSQFSIANNSAPQANCVPIMSQFSIAGNSAPQASCVPVMSQFSIANNSAPQANCVPIMSQFSIAGNSAPQASCVPIMNQFSIASNSAPQANCGPTISQFSNVEPFVPSISNVVSDSLQSQINAGKSSQSRCFSAAENAESSSRFQMPFVSRPISHVPQSFTSFDAAPKPLIATSTLSKPLPHNIGTIKTPVYVSRSDAVIQPKSQFVQTLSHDNGFRHSYLHQANQSSQYSDFQSFEPKNFSNVPPFANNPQIPSNSGMVGSSLNLSNHNPAHVSTNSLDVASVYLIKQELFKKPANPFKGSPEEFLVWYPSIQNKLLGIPLNS